MRAMILAAGRGERMGKLTQDTPKPLLRVGNHYLIEYAIQQIKHANIVDIVINISYHADKIKNALGDGSRYGVNIIYSEEKERLETGGGIVKALPLLGDDTFLVMSSDIITDFPLQNLTKKPEKLAHLIMVPNPSYHTEGDFSLDDNDDLGFSHPRLTYANIGLFSPTLFRDCTVKHFRLADLLVPAIQKQLISGEFYSGNWFNMTSQNDLEIFECLIEN